MIMIEELGELPVWFFVIFGCLMLLFCFWLWALLHCFSSKRLLSEQKFFWAAVIVAIPFFGILLYFLFVFISRQEFFQRHHHKPNESKEFVLSKKHKLLFGVCGGIADYLGVSPLIVRISWVLFVATGFVIGTLCSVFGTYLRIDAFLSEVLFFSCCAFSIGVGIFAYLLFLIIMSKKVIKNTAEETKIRIKK